MLYILVIASLLLHLVQSGAAQSKTKCSKGYQYFQHTGNCYKLMSTVPSSNGAKQVCAKETATLVSIPDHETNTFVANLSNESQLIGLFYQTSKYIWSDGTTLNFSNWQSGYPMRQEYFGNCVRMRSIGTWYNTVCGHSNLPFVCEKPPDRTVTTMPTTKTLSTTSVQPVTCPDPQQYYFNNGTITSPGYPNVHTGQKLLCQYQLLVPTGSRASITFNLLLLYSSDSIRVYEGLQNPSLLSTINSNSNGREITVTTKTKNMMIVLYNSDSGSNGVWKAEWGIAPEPSTSTTKLLTTTQKTRFSKSIMTPSTTITSTSTPTKLSTTDQITHSSKPTTTFLTTSTANPTTSMPTTTQPTFQCPSSIIQSSSGFLSSPGYPHGYPMNLACWYIIRARIGKRIWLEFLNVDTFQCCDLVLVYSNGANDQEPNIVLSGKRGATSVVSTKNELAILFTSSAFNSTNLAGWIARFKEIPGFEERLRVAVSNEVECSSGWFQNSNKCHRVYEEGERFDEAMSQCQQNQANISLADNALDNFRTAELMRNGEDIQKLFWLGLIYVEDEWKWTDGRILKYNNWANDEPNFLHGKCAAIESWTGYWRAVDCGETLPYMCLTQA